MSKEKSIYELAKKGALSNDLLTKWLLELEERIRILESYCKACPRKDELAGRKMKRKE